jgi:hypothetical protein
MNKVTTIAVIAMLAVSSFAKADEAAVQALERKCEAAREAKLKPLRDAEIARCKTEQNKEAGYCERYWSDFGDAKRNPNGTMQPRMFSDLRECVAAEDARRKLRLGE